ncbi:MAG TPA: hypothetical protein PLL69_11885, partial [Gemmatimonadales bacterium]|nr:hypothetical protein [Gemmatimonadales bacterium]
MQTVRSVLAPVLMLGLAACGADPSGSEPPPSRARDGSLTGLAVAVTTAPVRAGGELNFTFTNGGRSVVTTGVLSCVNHYERDAGDGTWTRLEPF